VALWELGLWGPPPPGRCANDQPAAGGGQNTCLMAAAGLELLTAGSSPFSSPSFGFTHLLLPSFPSSPGSAAFQGFGAFFSGRALGWLGCFPFYAASSHCPGIARRRRRFQSTRPIPRPQLAHRNPWEQFHRGLESDEKG
jgi:hypothetical protein